MGLRQSVLPLLGSHAARAHASEGEGGDITFAIDAEAEAFLERFLAEGAPDVAFYSEDRGLVAPERAETVLVVDPVDGTRPALAGFEACCVSVAAAPLREGVTMGEVSHGCVVEIRSGAVFLAERGLGLVESPQVRLSANQELERMFLAYGFRGRPARPQAAVLAPLIDAASVGGGTFELGSAAFDMTRVLTGQLDAYAEPGPRIIVDVPSMLEEFLRVGRGTVLNNSPYDLAAATLCLEEGGAVVTDAYGEPLGPNPLLGSGREFQMSVVAAANPVLHQRVVEAIGAGVASLGAGTV